ncbi:MAG: hypothetical protein CMJ18_14925 [Phycisphaeraceae bacterium]|nr:hypothetical protein [Phycisphaeraceae bacterium]
MPDRSTAIDDAVAFPQSFAQQRLWFIDRMLPDRSGYHITRAFRIEGALDVDAVRGAVGDLIQRHEVLRTTFAIIAGEPVQVIAPAIETPWSEAEAPDAAPARLDQLIMREAGRPFDLERGPLLRVRCIRLGPDTHVLVLVIHHIVADGWSLGVLFEDLSRFYSHRVTGRSDALAQPPAELPIQYADYAQWQRQWLQGDVLGRLEDYWRAHLEGLGELNLPLDRPRPAVQAFRGAAVSLPLSHDLVRAHEELAGRHEASFFMSALAVFSLVLRRYCGQNDIVVASPIANRNRAETEPLIGFFANTLLLRTRLEDAQTFRSLLTQVRDTAWAAYDHQEMPYEMIVESLQPQRDVSRNPLAQVVFADQNAPTRPPVLAGLKVEALRTDTLITRFDLEMHLQRGNGASEAHCIYNRDLFDEGTIRRWLDHYHRLLEAAVEQPDVPVAELRMLSDEQRRQMLVTWNRNDAPMPEPALVTAAVEQQASRTPDVVAVLLGPKALTYGQLDDGARRIARQLRSEGIGPESLVAMCLPRSLDMAVALMAVLKAGGAFVPLDPAQPSARLRGMLELVKPALLLTHRGAPLPTDLVTSEGLKTLDFERLAEAAPEHPDADPESGAEPDHLVYVQFTSGSTGRPKAVAMPHTPLVNLIRWQVDHSTVGVGDRTLQFAPLSFDVSFQEIFSTWASGGTLCLVDDSVRRDPRALYRLTRNQGIARLFLPFVALQQLAEIARNDDGAPPDHLREIITAGEQLRIVPEIAEFFEKLPRCTLCNHYGPTECHLVSAFTLSGPPQHWPALPPIGKPISNTCVYLLDERGDPVPIGVAGHLHVGGTPQARGYLGDDATTHRNFVQDPFAGTDGARMYRTGDLARYRPDGVLEFLGRADDQVKIRGYRVEPAEIATVLSEHEAVRQCAVIATGESAERRLVAYVVANNGTTRHDTSVWREHLRRRLPQHMIPASFVTLERIPLTASGKVDADALPEPEAAAPQAVTAPRNTLEQQIADIWSDLLETDTVGTTDNFFDLGGHSLLLVRLQSALADLVGREIPIVDLFQHPTVQSLAAHLGGGAEPNPSLVAAARARRRTDRAPDGAESSIAIIGMAGRFPGAADVETFWRNLCDGRESIVQFTDAELAEVGVERRLIEDPHYVAARGVLADVDRFDAGFFGYSPREAELIDPQQRLFLQCASEVLERSGYDPHRYDGLVGCYAGTSANTYQSNLRERPDVLSSVPPMHVLISSDKDFLPTRVSYKLNLHGPSVNIQTACSTSLVAVHQACRDLVDRQCDIALAGGVCVTVPLVGGFMTGEQSIMSPDGHCSAFDAEARGTVKGDGVAIVALKRLEAAQRDGDHIHAVIRGTAINNDGARKVGFTAPSAGGQALAIAAAQAEADVPADTIGYIEAHGTGTALGDPIEIEALTRVFREQTSRRGFCAIGSVKTNIGHLDAAAGVAGIIKAALALEQRTIPPSLNFTRPNPRIDFESSPFYVNTERRTWNTPDGAPRRAGVSSFGIGGTNAHVILEEPPAPETGEPDPDRCDRLLVISARSATALAQTGRQLGAALRRNDGVSLADVAFTLQVGRTEFEHRRAVVARDTGQAAEVLEATDADRSWTRHAPTTPAGPPSVAYLLPGQGAQYLGMARRLDATEPVFRDVLRECLDLAEAHVEADLATLLLVGNEKDADPDAIVATAAAQPALFAVEYAMARLVRSYGIEPAACIGHSIGEFVAACLSGVMSPGDALSIVAERGRLMQDMPSGSMISIGRAAEEVESYLSGDGPWIAAINGPSMCVVSGTGEQIADLGRRLAADGVEARPLHTSHAFHCPLMQNAVAPFVEAQARSTPDAVAVTLDDAHLTYAQLDAQAEQVAACLRDHGAGPETAVGICLPRSLEMTAAVLGVLKSEAAYVPLDPSYPPDRLMLMVRDANLTHVLTQSSEPRCVPDALARRFMNVVDAEQLRLHSVREAETVVSTTGLTLDPAERAAYVIYTSGSTGRPKGVSMSHGALCHLIRWQTRDHDDAALRTVQFASLSFDVSFQEIFSTWSAGGTLHLVGEQVRRDPERLLDALERQAIERIFLPFVALEQLAEAAQATSALPSALRYIVTAGEQLRITPAIAALVRRLPGVRLDNQYGPTETHAATSFVLQGRPDDWPVLPPIGRQMPHTRIYLLDRHRQPVPIGAPGEVYIGGQGLARGCRNQETLTAERFLEDPFAGASGARMYRTGDLARFRSDGNLEFLGRSDDQVKIRGFRVEPGEIESVLGGHPDLRQAVVTAPNDAAHGHRLIAYVVAKNGAAPSEESLRAHLKDALPEYMVPSMFVALDALPLTASGKVDRSSLEARRPEMTAGPSTRAFVAPETEMETEVARAWSQVLGMDRIGRHDNFFDLGGHSLLATRVAARLRTTTSTALPLADLFQHPTVADLAARLQALKNLASPAPQVTARDRSRPAPLSCGQQRLWFLNQMDPDNPGYNLPAALRLEGPIDIDALERSLADLADRHESLRTRFTMETGAPVQVIAAKSVVPFAIIDLAEADDGADLPSEARRRAADEAIRPFDLTESPLWRAALLRIERHHHLLVLVLHHAIADGWSMQVLTDDLTALYAAHREDRRAELPPLAVQYADFSDWQNRWLDSPAMTTHVAYWKQALEGIVPLDLPLDHERPAMQTMRGAYETLDVPEALAGSLRALGRDEAGATPFMVMLAAFNVLLHATSGERDIAVGSPIANRTEAQTQGLIGFFVNMLVLRTKLDPDVSFVDLLRQTRRTALEAYEHQDLPFERLVQQIDPDRDTSRNPLFQASFSLQPAPPARWPMADLTASAAPIHVQTARFDLECFVWDRQSDLRFVFVYNCDLFEAATIRSMLHAYRRLLEAIIATPAASIATLVMDDETNPVLMVGDAARSAAERRSARPAPAPQRRATPADFVAPQTDMEILLADLWARLLDVDHVGVHDNFYDLGGHSLLVMRAVGLLESEHGIRIGPQHFLTQSLAQVAAMCAQNRSDSTKRRSGDLGGRIVKAIHQLFPDRKDRR